MQGNTEQADIAVKYIKKEHLIDKKVNENMQREINILKGLSDCPNVVRLWESLVCLLASHTKYTLMDGHYCVHG